MSDLPLVGVDVGGTKLLLAALRQGVMGRAACPPGRVPAPSSVEREARSFLARPDSPPAALGVAVPGLVDRSGVATPGCATFLRLEGRRARDAFADLGRPVRALNDADAAPAMRPTTSGPTPPRRSSWRARRSGPRCGPKAAAAAGGARMGGRVRLRAGLYERTIRGDPGALAAVRKAGRALGLGPATLANLLNPELLVLGGAPELPGYREATLESAERWALPDPWRACEVRPVHAGAAVVALGTTQEAA